MAFCCCHYSEFVYKCNLAECFYKCHNAEMLHVIMLSNHLVSVVILGVIMRSVVILIVTVMSDAAHMKQHSHA